MYDLGDHTTESDYDDWYQKEVSSALGRKALDADDSSQHMPVVAKVPGFVRCTRFKLVYYRTNAQSRQLKGLPARAEDKVIEVPPTYMNLFEFDTESPDMKALLATGETEWSRKIIEDAKNREVGIYRFVTGYGDRKFFH